MSKNIIHGKTGKVINGRKNYGNIIVDYFEGVKRKEDRINNPIPKQKGVRLIVLEAYEKGGKDAAYEAIKIANNRIGMEAYSKKTVDEWIEEYEQQTRESI